MSNLTNQLLIGNWKLNPTSLKKAKQLSSEIIKLASYVRGVDFILCPPHLYIQSVKSDYRGKKVSFGAQDLSIYPSGAHTGEVSAEQLQDLGVSHVILGHSERRAPVTQGGAGETNELIAEKIQVALKYSQTPIVCIGESDRDPSGRHLKFIETQILQTFANLAGKRLTEIIIAYEPIWAIGGNSNRAITGHDLYEMMLYIRKVLTKTWGAATATKVKIIYGGSVKDINAFELSRDGNMDGFLVGGASLEATSFVGIAKEMARASKEKTIKSQ